MRAAALPVTGMHRLDLTREAQQSRGPDRCDVMGDSYVRRAKVTVLSAWTVIA